jgi:hypothetical protein
MSFKLKAGTLLCVGALICSTTWAQKSGSRPSSGYGPQSSSAVSGPANVSNIGAAPTSGTFQELVVACSMTPCGTTTSGFDLLINTPVYPVGTSLNFSLDSSAFNSSSDPYGLMDGCDGTVIPFCITPASVTGSAACESSILNGLSGSGSSVRFAVPSCAAGGITLYFDESSTPNGQVPAFATISANTSTVTTPEPSSAVLLGLGLLVTFFVHRRRMLRTHGLAC